MKTIQFNAQKLFSGVISFFLTLLGFSSCDSVTGVEQPCEYGTPSAKFKITGKIVSQENKQGVKGIQVTIKEIDTWKDGLGIYYENPGETHRVLSKENGSFNLEYTGFPTSKKYIYLLEDIDGNENGNFELKLDSVLLTNPQFKNGNGHWYSGETEKDFGNLEIKPKKSE